MFRPSRYNSESGQTLIETIVAIFLLTTALTTALGLAIYAFGTVSTSQTQVIASNLAREGIDVIRMMRDSNWLAGDAVGGGNALQVCADTGTSCYPNAYTGPSYNILLTNAPLRVLLTSTNPPVWSLDQGNDYRLYLQANGTYTTTVNGDSTFARKIVITTCSTPTVNCTQYTAQNPELKVQSIVGWSGKRCSVMTNNDPSTTNCKVIVEEDLTNWKDYQ